MAARARMSVGARRIYAQEPYVCPACSLRQHARFTTRQSPSSSTDTGITRPTRKHSDQQRTATSISYQTTRHASSATLASTTAINAPSTTPAKFRTLHQKLAKLQDEAAGYVDLSRLQLALRSLEKENATSRIALLTLDDNAAKSARRLARALLSDALGTEQTWETELLSRNVEESVLLRYGQPGDLSRDNGLTHSIIVPSRFLQDNHIEILIAPFRSSTETLGDTSEDLEDALLVPTIPIPAPHGRLAFVRSPVHKAIILASGINGATQLGRLRLPTGHDSISCIIDTALTPKSQLGEHYLAVDTEMATIALGNFRHDDAGGGAFGNAWVASSVSSAAELIASPSKSVGVDYAEGLLDATEHTLEREAAKVIVRQDPAPAQAAQEELQGAISTWSAQAHRDLRDNLLVAFESRAWRRTVWWRLLWRIDDVTYSTSDIVNRCWLNEAEQTLAYLSGRIHQAGLATEDELKEPEIAQNELTLALHKGMRSHESAMEKKGVNVPELIQLPTLLSRAQQQTGMNPLFDPPWPQTIALARQAMLHTDVPTMHRVAQGLLLTTYSTIGGTAALGGWLWVASAGVALYESGAIAALGLVWSLRRLQRRWGKEREVFTANVQENGRKVLAEIETQLRMVVRDAHKVSTLAEDTEHFVRARQAIRDCRQVLKDAAEAGRQ